MQIPGSRSYPAIDRGVAIQVGLFLAGLAGEEVTASRLGIGSADLRNLLRELSLGDCRMMPVSVDADLGTYFLDMAGETFDAPTFDAIAERAAMADGQGSRTRFQLPAHDILAAAAAPCGAAPDAMILHVGRCGSTLLCNLLANTGDWVALREPEVCNQLFIARAATRDPPEIERIETLAGQLMGCFARSVRPRKSVVKLSSWTAKLAVPLLARLHATRIIVVVRDPWTTVASFLAEPPHWYGDRPVGMELTGQDRAEAAHFFANAWRTTVEAACRLPKDRTLFIDYDDLSGDPVAVLAAVRHHLRDRGPPADPVAVSQTMGSYSKGASAEPFDPSGIHRRAPLDVELADIVTAVAACEWRACSERWP